MDIDMIQQAFSDVMYIEPKLTVSHVLPEPVGDISNVAGLTLAFSRDLKHAIDVHSGNVKYTAPNGTSFHPGSLYRSSGGYIVAQVTPTKFVYLDDNSFLSDKTFSELPEPVQPFISSFQDRIVVCSKDGKRFYDLKTRKVCLESREAMSPEVISVDRTYLVNIKGTLYDTTTGIKLKLPAPVVSDVQKLGDDTFLVMSAYAQRFFDLHTKAEYRLHGKHMTVELYPTINNINGMWLVMGTDAKTFYDIKTGEIAFKLPEKVRAKIPWSGRPNEYTVIGEDSQTVHTLTLEKRLNCALDRVLEELNVEGKRLFTKNLGWSFGSRDG